MTYAGVTEEFGKLETAKVVLIPVPYDGTSTWVKGADKGPGAFLDASENMELYDIETNSEPYQAGVFLAEAITEKSTPESMVYAVHAAVKKYLDLGKFVTIFGGEHSISIGTIRGFKEKYNDLTVVQFDAHADLRDEFHGSPYNHACAVHEANKTTNLIQIGIRSVDGGENKFMKRENVFFAEHIYNNTAWEEKALAKMTGNIFITIDLDVFDPSILPSTGTPEPGGLLWYQMITFLRKIFSQKNVVGFDIVELAANENERSSDFVAAKLYYKMLAYKFFNNK
jgi:agmatinase